jgi:tetratricopeptide (TPR) repeat protein
MNIKAKVLELLDLSHALQQAMVAELTEEERNATGTLQHWSAKDALAHVAEWNTRLAAHMDPASEPPPPVEDFNRFNDELFEKHVHDSWPTVLAFSEQANQALVQRVRDMDEDALLASVGPEGDEGQPVWRRIVGTGYTHAMIHLGDLYVHRGQPERTSQLYEDLAARLLPLDDSPRWQGTQIYNVACGYALAGQADKALAKLRQALPLNPDLVAWSKQDSDLDSLRGLPAFDALFEELSGE